MPNREIGFGSCVRASGRGEAKLHALARRCCFLRWGPGPEDVFRPAGRRPAPAGRRPAPAVPRPAPAGRAAAAAGREPRAGAWLCNSMQFNAIQCNPMQFQCNPMQFQCNSNAIPMQFQCNSKVCSPSRFVAGRGLGPGCAIQCNSANSSAIPMQFLCNSCAIPTQFQCNSKVCSPSRWAAGWGLAVQFSVIPMQFLCNSYAIPMPMQCQCNANAIPMQSNAIQCNSMQFNAINAIPRSVPRRGSSRFVAALQGLLLVAVRRSVSVQSSGIKR